MAEVGWCFPVLTGGGEEGYTSNDIEAFKGEDLFVNLIRETCQNSLDAKEPSSELPVRVEFKLRRFEAGKYAFFRQYAKHVERCRDYWRSRKDGIPERLEQLLRDAKNTLDAEIITALVVSDFNTPGLVGSEDFSGSFNALVYAEGVSYKQSDTSAGSFGIGRNAPFACSSLSCVCYNTMASDGGNAFAGIAKLATATNAAGQKTRKNGRYQYNDNDEGEWRPLKPSDGDDFAKEFKRNEFGTDVIILGFDASDEWQDQLKRAVIKNFFLAIHEGKLVVSVEDKIIDASTLPTLLECYAEDKDIELALECYKAIVESSGVELDVLTEGDARLFIRTGSENERLKGVAWFRGNGMLIRQYKPAGIFRPYVAVFVAGGELDRLLRKTEPARHNDWDYKRLPKGSEERKLARKAMCNIRSEIKTSLQKACEAIVDKSIDAEGAAGYLPDSDGGGAGEGGGSDALRPLIKIDRVKINRAPRKTETVRARRGEGSPSKGRAGNESRHPNPKPESKPPVPVEGSGESRGVRSGRGRKTIVRPVEGLRRMFALAPSVGVYRFVMIPNDSTDEAYAACSVIGENGHKDAISVQKAMMGGKPVRIDGEDTIGPFALAKGERTEMVITFASRSNMALEVDLWMGGRRK